MLELDTMLEPVRCTAAWSSRLCHRALPARCAQVYVMPGEAIVRAGDMARELAFLAKVRA